MTKNPTTRRRRRKKRPAARRRLRWRDVAGKRCELCGGPATHYYGFRLLCCDCHVGEPGGGIFTPEDAARGHERVLRGMAGEAETQDKETP